MLENETLWTTAVSCHTALHEAGVPHVIVGDVAVCLHGYRRNTVDLDMLIRPEDQARVRAALEAIGFQWTSEHAEFRSASGSPVQFLLTGERADRDAEVYLPDPASAGVTKEIEGLAVIDLARLIEIKLACGLGSPRRTHRDLADAMELVAVHGLGTSFARYLHKSLRSTFRKLVEQSRS